MVSCNVSFFQNGCFKSKAEFNVLGALFFLAENAFFDFRSALPNLVGLIRLCRKALVFSRKMAEERLLMFSRWHLSSPT